MLLKSQPTRFSSKHMAKAQIHAMRDSTFLILQNYHARMDQKASPMKEPNLLDTFITESVLSVSVAPFTNMV